MKTSEQLEYAYARIELEKTILGACLLENCYHKIADILTHRNFSAKDIGVGHLVDHQEIFKVFEKFYPLIPIDLVTVRYELRYSPAIAIYVTELTALVSGTSNLTYYAFRLVEDNVRRNFIDLLESWMPAFEGDLETTTALREIIQEALNLGNDILRVIAISGVHLRNLVADRSLIAAIMDFGSAAKRRIEKIKQLSSIDSLVNNLVNMARLPFDPDTKMAVNHLTDLLKAIISTGKINAAIADQICKIRIR